MKKVQKRLKSPIKGEVVNLSNFERVLLKLLHSGFELYIGISNIAHSKNFNFQKLDDTI